MGLTYLLHHTFRDVDVLHGNNLSKVIQTVNVLDLIHELHTAEDNKTITK